MLKKSNSKINFKDGMLLGVAFLIALISLFYLISGKSNFALDSASDDTNNQSLVGEITVLKNDNRRRETSSLSWDKARDGQKIHEGDALFVGKASYLSLKLKDGSQIDLNENTLIEFSKIDGRQVPNLSFGNMKVAVNGNLKVAINGKVQEIKGQSSEVEISVDQKKNVHLKLLKGKAEVKATATAQAQPLTEEHLATLQNSAEPEVQATPVPAKIITYHDQQKLIYTDQLYDFYERQNQKLLLRAERRSLVKLDVKLKWESEGQIKEVNGQISNSMNFAGPVMNFNATGTDYLSPYAYLGENFWRLSILENNWLPPQKFFVSAQPLQVPAPLVHFKNDVDYLLNDQLIVKAEIRAPKELNRFIIESSNDASFTPAHTQVRLQYSKQVFLTITQAQDIYLRTRGLNEKLEVTTYSEIVKLSVRRPELPLQPVLSRNNFKIFQNQILNIDWPEAPAANAYEVEVKDQDDHSLVSNNLEDHHYSFMSEKLGSFKLNIRSVDRFHRRSANTQAHIIVLAAPALPLARQEPVVSPRQPSSTMKNELVIESTQLLDRNQNYSKSILEVDGGGATVYSSEQALAGSTDHPLNFNAALKVLHWLTHSGFEGSIQSKVFGTNAISNQISPLLLEARYLYRWHPQVTPWLPSTQFALILGYENYRNQASGLYSPGYDILKTGFMLSFPFWHRWDTGGEALIGRGFDQSRKYEISGNLNYYFKNDWSFGVGYHVHFFDAGSASATPFGLPYREGAGEAFSILRKYY